MICDWWISIRFVCFCVSRLVALFLKSTVSFILVLSFFNLFILKRGKFRFQRWNFSYRASKSRENTGTERWKRTGTFPLTFTFADKHSRCYGNGLIDVAKKFEFGACSRWIVEDIGRGSFLLLFSSPEPVVLSSGVCQFWKKRWRHDSIVLLKTRKNRKK